MNETKEKYVEDIRRMISALDEADKNKILQHLRAYIEELLKD